MTPIVKYLQETRAELRHVAWPTRAQTIVYTVLVMALSLGIALYLGLFDYVFTSTLYRTLPAISNVGGLKVTQDPSPLRGTPFVATPQTPQDKPPTKGI